MFLLEHFKFVGLVLIRHLFINVDPYGITNLLFIEILNLESNVPDLERKCERNKAAFQINKEDGDVAIILASWYFSKGYR